MKTYNIEVNLNEGQKFTQAEFKTIGTVEAENITAANSAIKAAMHGHPDGDAVKFTVDVNRYSGMTMRAVTK